VTARKSTKEKKPCTQCQKVRHQTLPVPARERPALLGLPPLGGAVPGFLDCKAAGEQQDMAKALADEETTLREGRRLASAYPPGHLPKVTDTDPQRRKDARQIEAWRQAKERADRDSSA
jgi:hypothetical protein